MKRLITALFLTRPDDPFTCSSGQYCGLNPSLAAIGCCTATFLGSNGVESASGCRQHSRCLDSTEYFSYCSQTNCADDKYLAWCTSTQHPYCRTYILEGDRGFNCYSWSGITRYLVASATAGTEEDAETTSDTAEEPVTHTTSPTSAPSSSPTTTSPTSGPAGGTAQLSQDEATGLQKEGNKIALGVGIGFGVATLLVGLWGVWKMRHRQSAVGNKNNVRG